MTDKIIPHSKFVETLFTDHDTAFELAIQTPDGKTIARHYTVRKTEGIKHWQVFALSPHGKEWFIAQRFGSTLIDILLTSQPSVTAWYYKWWSLLEDYCERNNYTNVQCRQLGYCKRCGKVLISPRAIARGYGQECFKHIDKSEE